MPKSIRERMEMSKEEKEVRKPTNETFPIKEISDDGICLTHNKKYRMIFKVIDPISLDLLSQNEVIDVILRFARGSKHFRYWKSHADSHKQ